MGNFIARRSPQPYAGYLHSGPPARARQSHRRRLTCPAVYTRLRCPRLVEHRAWPGQLAGAVRPAVERGKVQLARGLCHLASGVYLGPRLGWDCVPVGPGCPRRLMGELRGQAHCRDFIGVGSGDPGPLGGLAGPAFRPCRRGDSGRGRYAQCAALYAILSQLWRKRRRLCKP